MWKFFKICGMTLGGFILVLGLYLGLLLYPEVLFAKHTQYKNYTLHSQQKLDADFVKILDRVDAALSTSPIYDPSIEHDVFFGADNAAFGFVQNLRWKVHSAAMKISPVLTYNLSWPPHFSNIITFRTPDVSNNALVHPVGSGYVNMTQVLTHEVVHTLLKAELGLPVKARTPRWKEEGYGDYIAASITTFANPSYNIQNSIQRILEQDLSWLKNGQGTYTPLRFGYAQKYSIRNEEGLYWPTCYYISRVLMEYLLDVKGMSFDEVMSPKVTDSGTLNELILAYTSGNLARGTSDAPH